MTEQLVDGRTYLICTPRSLLRAGASVNLHCAWNTQPWVPSKRDVMLEAIFNLGVGVVRDAVFSHNTDAQVWYQELVSNDVALLLNIPDSRLPYITADIGYLASRPFAKGVRYLAGRNEPNANDATDAWVAKTIASQSELYMAAMQYADKFLGLQGILGPAAKHEHVKDYDGDLRKLGEAGIAEWTVDLFNEGPFLDYHYYPGWAGPFTNLAEKQRAEVGYGYPIAVHSETGWQEGDQSVSPELKARYCVEALLRDRLNGCVLTSIYELADDSTGKFGLVNEDGTLRPAGQAVGKLLNDVDGPGVTDQLWWAADSPHVPYVATSQGSGFTVYALPDDPGHIELVTQPSFKINGYEPNTGPRGNLHWPIDLLDSMHVLDVVAV